MNDGTGDAIETERKYQAGSGFAVPDLTGLSRIAAVTEPQAYQLMAVYFDTPGLRLLSAHVTLRRRTGGPDAGWHLKLPVGADSRREVHASLGDDTGTVPARLAAIVAEWAAGQPLRPVARIETARTVRTLLDDAGRALAEVADDRVTGSVPVTAPAGQAPAAAPAGQLGAWRVVAAWREIEVELVTGSRDLLDAVGARLRQAGAAPSAAPSKLSLVLKAAGET